MATHETSTEKTECAFPRERKEPLTEAAHVRKTNNE
jgi:hypothetical protein